MARAAVLGVLWIASIVGLATARAVVNCMDGGQCNKIKVVVQSPQDVAEVMSNYPRSNSVDFHGNLLTKFLIGYSQPTVYWSSLNLSYNLLEDDVFASFRSPQLKYVDITYNKLQRASVPPSVVEFTAKRNNLHSINIQPRSALQRLILPMNKIDSFRGISNLPQLTELDLSCNDLEKLNPAELSTMPQLRSLTLANNHIAVIEGTNQIMRSLEHLDLSNNLLTTVDETFSNFPSIKRLFLQGNKIVMWLTQYRVPNSLQEVRMDDNDWDCSNLKTTKAALGNKLVRNNIACTDAESPYADRLIKYRKLEFEALRAGNIQREGPISCDSYSPSPCDGDDNLVFEVAGSSARSAEDLAKRELTQLEGDLGRAQNNVAHLQQQIAAAKRENDQLTSENNDLAHYINEEYQAAGLTGLSDPVGQLNALFDHYEAENTDLKNKINAEERINQDKLNEITVLQGEMDDETFRRDKLLENVEKHNKTMIGYQNKIVELQRQLG